MKKILKPTNQSFQPIILKPSELKPHPRNARVHPEANILGVMNSLTEFGQVTPIVTWNNLVIKGCGTLEAIKRLGWKEVKTINADHFTEAKAEAYALADNKLTDMSHFDFSIVADVLRDLEGKSINLDVTGFQQFEREPLLQASFSPATPGNLPSASEQASKSLTFTKDQWAIIQESLTSIRENEDEFDTKSEAAAIVALIYRYNTNDLARYKVPF